MLMARRLASERLRPGHTLTQTPQPVQSSGETWMVILWPCRCLSRKSLEGNVSGAPASTSGS